MSTSTLPAPAANAAIAEWRMLVDGALVGSSSGALFADVDPATEEVAGVTADGTPADMDAAIGAARRAFDTSTWSRDAAFRRHCLEQLHAALERHKEEIRPLLVTEVGTPVWLTRDTLLDVPIDRLADYARMATEYPYETGLPDLDFRGVVSRRRQRREAVGVVAAITPWNFPWRVNLIKIGPALAAGNTVVLKPAPDTPWSGTIIGRLAAEETDMPAGVLNVVTWSDHALGAQLATDPRVDLVTFTGSTATGRRIMAAAAATLKRVFLELGGKSAHIVLDDADIEAAAAAAGATICVTRRPGLRHRAAACCCRASGTRRGVEAAAAAIDAVALRRPAGDPGNIMGPLISAQPAGAGARLHRDGHGARARGWCCGGGAPAAPAPRLLRRADALRRRRPRGRRSPRRRSSGRCWPSSPTTTTTTPCAIANDSVYGLSGAVVGADERAGARGGRAGSAPGTMQRQRRPVVCSPDVPFGGYKQSGIGREMGVAGFEEYLETKVLGLSTGLRSASASW